MGHLTRNRHAEWQLRAHGVPLKAANDTPHIPLDPHSGSALYYAQYQALPEVRP